MRFWLSIGLLVGTTLASNLVQAQAVTSLTHPRILVELGAASTQPTSGRLLVFATAAKDAVVDTVDADPFRATQTTVAAQEVSHWEPGQSVSMDADGLAFPAGYSQLPPGDYYVQAVLDVDHNYNYSGRGPGDFVSDVVKLHLPFAGQPRLTLSKLLPAQDPWQVPESAPTAEREAMQAARIHAHAIAFNSPSLSAFWGRPIGMQAWVLTPPDYDANATAHYPTVYFTHGFGGTRDRMVGQLSGVYGAMAAGQMPPMLWVFLDESSPTGTHEFADSVNNGPWGQALTQELIPHLESQYRMDGKPSGRFLQGHSSGGWATLWLQTRYPKLFGGTWSTSPDPSDFHDFTGVDLYAPQANAYVKPDGSPYPLVRDHGKVIGTFEQFAKLERVLGNYGGQLASFDWVFSPRGPNGAPMPMFDRDTGAVNPEVVAYWREHYDIGYQVQTHWKNVRPDLDGKVHLVVGTADTFYLDGAAMRLKDVFERLGAKADFRFLKDRTHFDIYTEGHDRHALLKTIAWEMYAIARPYSKLRRDVF
ncbi:MAG: alpha/beta hydrolase-fold protein [Rhodoferax sp.]